MFVNNTKNGPTSKTVYNLSILLANSFWSERAVNRRQNVHVNVAFRSLNTALGTSMASPPIPHNPTKAIYKAATYYLENYSPM